MPALLANKLSLWGFQASSKYVFPMGSCIDLLDNEQYVSATGNDVHDHENHYCWLSGSMI